MGFRELEIFGCGGSSLRFDYKKMGISDAMVIQCVPKEAIQKSLL